MSSSDIRVTIPDDAASATSHRSRLTDQAEARARAAEQAARRALADRNQQFANLAAARRQALEIAVDAAQTEAQTAKKEITTAGEIGDYEKQAEAYDKLAFARARQQQLETAQAALAARPAPTVTVPADPVESYIEGRTEPTQRWLRQHTDWITDPRKNAKLTSAHWGAVGEGLIPDTPEYFAHVERRIGLRDERMRNVRSNDASSHLLDGGRTVYLTAGERERATDGSLVWNHGPKRGQPIGVEEFARRKIAMHAEGRYNRLD
jgi:hypothetical protein